MSFQAGEKAKTTFTVLNRDDLRRNKSSQTAVFEGYQHADANLSFFWVDLPRGGGPSLHKHLYEEVFILLEGCATFTVGSETLEATTGQVVIAPPETQHKFVNSGAGRLRQIDIHPSKQVIQEMLED